MQLQQRIRNATKKSQLPGLKHSALAVPSSQAEDFSASRLKKYLFEREEHYNRHDFGSKDRGLIFRQGCFAVPQTINVQMMSVECKEESKGRGWWGKYPVCLSLSVFLYLSFSICLSQFGFLYLSFSISLFCICLSLLVFLYLSFSICLSLFVFLYLSFSICLSRFVFL